jgi:hypothetical protein
MRSLSFKESAFGLRSGSLAPNGEPEMILFFASVGVKDNRKDSSMLSHCRQSVRHVFDGSTIADCVPFETDAVGGSWLC